MAVMRNLLAVGIRIYNVMWSAQRESALLEIIEIYTEMDMLIG